MTAKSVFQILCDYNADFMSNFGYPIPRKVIQESLGLSKSKTLKELQKLRKEGLVKLSRVSCYDDYSCESFILIGYLITEKGRETVEYKSALESVNKRIIKCFGQY